GHAHEDTTTFRRLRDLEPCDFVRGQLGNVEAGEGDAALAGARIAENRHHQRRFAGTVGADERHDLALADVDVDSSEGGDMAVIGLYPAHSEERRVHCGAPVLTAPARWASPPILPRPFPPPPLSKRPSPPAPRLCLSAGSLSARTRAGWGPRACRSGANPSWRRIP